jgi:hypothetical protein
MPQPLRRSRWLDGTRLGERVASDARSVGGAAGVFAAPARKAIRHEGPARRPARKVIRSQCDSASAHHRASTADRHILGRRYHINLVVVTTSKRCHSDVGTREGGRQTFERLCRLKADRTGRSAAPQSSSRTAARTRPRPSIAHHPCLGTGLAANAHIALKPSKRTQTRPGQEMCRGRKPAHVAADLRQDDPR